MILRCICPVLLAFASALYGQPADEPKLFAGGMIAPLGPTNVTFAPDGKAVYFAQNRCQIMTSHFQAGQWSAPVPMEFSGPYRDGDPFLSPDGSQLFFWSTRPLNGRQRSGLALWVAEKTSGGWGVPRDLGVSVNGPDGGAGFPVVAANGTLYFMAHRPDSLGRRDIYRAKRVGDHYAEPENLGPVVNSPHDEWDAYIAPDESFLIFASSRPGGFGYGDLYISARKDGAWTPPRNLGPKINGKDSQCCPAVSPDGKHFFFTRTAGIYRVGIAALGLAPAAGSEGPSEDPELFAPGIISVPGVFGITFSPDGKTAYFAESGSSIVTSRQQDGKWSVPAPLEFSGRHTDLFPSLSPDGSRLFFTSSRPRSGQKPSLAQWVSERTGAGWSEPRDLGAAINGTDGGGAGSVAANGTLYFAARRPDSIGNRDIYRARRTSSGYAEPENLGPAINSPRGENEVYVAPDESFIVFSSDRPGGLGASDFYISSFKNGAWTPPRNLGPNINSPGPECCPSVSPDGKHFYFNRLGGDKPGVYQAGIAALGLEQK